MKKRTAAQTFRRYTLSAVLIVLGSMKIGGCLFKPYEFNFSKQMFLMDGPLRPCPYWDCPRPPDW